jgi:hypothetical protein
VQSCHEKSIHQNDRDLETGSSQHAGPTWRRPRSPSHAIHSQFSSSLCHNSYPISSPLTVQTSQFSASQLVFTLLHSPLCHTSYRFPFHLTILSSNHSASRPRMSLVPVLCLASPDMMASNEDDATISQPSLPVSDACKRLRAENQRLHEENRKLRQVINRLQSKARKLHSDNDFLQWYQTVLKGFLHQNIPNFNPPEPTHRPEETRVFLR